MKDLITKMIRSKFSIIYLLLFIGAIYLIQEKAIMPLVMGVLKSDLFFEKTIEENEPLGKLDVRTERTAYALSNCRDAVKKEGDLDVNAVFLDNNYEAWALGNRQYLIRSSVRLTDPEQGQVEKLYACTIRMTGEDQSDPDSWTILGVDFNPQAN